MEWVTRAGVRVDRASMIWLIRRFVDPEAKITILPEGEVMAYAERTGATPFHHPQAPMRNTGVRTGFDAVLVQHELHDPALAVLALILRGAETADRTLTQWSPGLKAIGDGLRRIAADDDAFIASMVPILDALYQFAQDLLAPVAKPTAPARER